ncbi:type 1 periplasmic binding fold superfamily protein [Psychroflexus planctonicus]|uniref:Type 1 periplasmic binding fold superfamily protein n=1 Tax=Psychroflexus planctonicus TaxID=1526575 RepID=A0ABQ1SFF7_9FLAO|nr:type 1 periplasmic binding fold superfamily protein [Psychroflexus planctonicus]GGE28750.1 hypothetical protein GCM10010832_06730 [Psychroflexus planctonicus]
MKSLKIVSLFSLLAVFSSCSDDDDNIQIINEEEVITTLTVTLVDQNTNEVKTLQYRDLDGDGPESPIVTADNLDANTTYQGSIEFLNELEDPAEDITEEVVEEGEEHQVFFVNSTALETNFDYLDADANNNPIGVEFSLTTGNASNGNLSIILIHDGDKFAEGAADGEINNVGGETDIEANFDVVIE